MVSSSSSARPLDPGGPCSSTTDCAPGSECLAGFYDGGLCGQPGCSTPQDCLEGLDCIHVSALNACVNTCNPSSDAGQCGAGAACVADYNSTPSVCLPIASAPCRYDRPDSCAMGRFCIRNGLDGYGQCQPACDLFLQDCGAGAGGVERGCYPQSGTNQCIATANKVINDACTAINECIPGAICTNASGSFQCKRMCDAVHPCSSGGCISTSTPGISVCEGGM